MGHSTAALAANESPYLAAKRHYPAAKKALTSLQKSPYLAAKSHYLAAGLLLPRL